MKTTLTDAITGRPTRAPCRRSIRTLTTDELRGVHGGNTSPTAATTDGPTGTSTNRQDGGGTPGTSMIKRAPQLPSQ
jgi:hypothetical protein